MLDDNEAGSIVQKVMSGLKETLKNIEEVEEEESCEKEERRISD